MSRYQFPRRRVINMGTVTADNSANPFRLPDDEPAPAIVVLEPAAPGAVLFLDETPAAAPCDCGSHDASWHGPEDGRREYCCDACWLRRQCKCKGFCICHWPRQDAPKRRPTR